MTRKDKFFFSYIISWFVLQMLSLYLGYDIVIESQLIEYGILILLINIKQFMRWLNNSEK